MSKTKQPKLYAAVNNHNKGSALTDLDHNIGAVYDSIADVVEHYDYEDDFAEDGVVQVIELTIKNMGQYKRLDSKIKIKKVK